MGPKAAITGIRNPGLTGDKEAIIREELEQLRGEEVAAESLGAG